MISKFKFISFILSSLFFVWSCGDKTSKISEIIEVDMEIANDSEAYKDGISLVAKRRCIIGC